MAKQIRKLNVAMIGYGFMGRAHSNAFLQVGHFFDLPYELKLKAMCGRNRAALEAMAAAVGLGGGSNRLAFRGQKKRALQPSPV